MTEDNAQQQHAPVYRPEGGRKIKGLFSTQTVEKVGTGTTQRKTISKMYWYCVQNDDQNVGVQALNKNMLPITHCVMKERNASTKGRARIPPGQRIGGAVSLFHLE